MISEEAVVIYCIQETFILVAFLMFSYLNRKISKLIFIGNIYQNNLTLVLNIYLHLKLCSEINSFTEIRQVAGCLINLKIGSTENVRMKSKNVIYSDSIEITFRCLGIYF